MAVNTKLNPECRGAFLQQILMVFDRRQNPRKGSYDFLETKRRQRMNKKFFKFLIICRQYLNSSRYHTVYCLAVTSSGKARDGFSVSFDLPGQCSNSSKVPFPLPICLLRKIGRLLNPKFLSVEYTGMNDQMMDECEKLMRMCSGKISIYNPHSRNEQQNLLLLADLSSRLHRLKCNSSFLTSDKSIVPKLNLEYYGDGSAPNIDQMQYILCSLKAKEISFHANEISSNDTNLADLKLGNNAIKKVFFDFYDCAKEKLDVFLKSLLKCCPQLQEIEMYMDFSDSELDIDHVAEQALEYYNWYTELKAAFSEVCHVYLQLWITVNCDIDQYDHSWKRELLSHAGFKNARDNSYREEDYIKNEISIDEKTDQFSGSILVCVSCEFPDD
jgi:hypothetical protein